MECWVIQTTPRGKNRALGCKSPSCQCELPRPIHVGSCSAREAQDFQNKRQNWAFPSASNAGKVNCLVTKHQPKFCQRLLKPEGKNQQRAALGQFIQKVIKQCTVTVRKATFTQLQSKATGQCSAERQRRAHECKLVGICNILSPLRFNSWQRTKHSEFQTKARNK